MTSFKISSLCGIADLFASSYQSSDNACLDVLWVVRLVMKVPVSVSWFAVDLSPDSATVLHNQSFLYFSGLMKVITASSKRCNKVCELFQQCMSEYRAGVDITLVEG